MAKAAPQPEYNIVLKQPALFATILTIVIAGIFLGALYMSAQGHHGAAPHGAAPGASSSAHGPDGMPVKAGAPPASAAPKH